MSFLPFFDNLVISAVKNTHFNSRLVNYANGLTKRFQIAYNHVNNSRRLKPIVLRNGLKFRVDITDSSGWFLYCYGRYTEKKTQEFIIQNLKEDSVFMDIGANIGYFSILAASHIGSNGQVYAIEANPELKYLIDESRKLNNLNNKIKIINKAATDINDVKIKLFLSGKINSHNSTIVPEIQGLIGREYNHFYEIDSITIDAFCKEHSVIPDIIKIDVEGAEDKVIAGMYETLNVNPPAYIIIETIPGNPVFELLKKSGYKNTRLEIFDHKNHFGNYLFYKK